MSLSGYARTEVSNSARSSARYFSVRMIVALRVLSVSIGIGAENDGGSMWTALMRLHILATQSVSHSPLRRTGCNTLFLSPRLANMLMRGILFVVHAVWNTKVDVLQCLLLFLCDGVLKELREYVYLPLRGACGVHEDSPVAV